MSLWCALDLPTFPLDRLGVRAKDPPLAVIERVGRRQMVVHASPAAERAGVRVGQSFAAARALCGELVTRPRDPAADQRELRALGLAALTFTPLVCVPTEGVSPPSPRCTHRDRRTVACGALAENFGLLLEIEGSQGVFGGLAPLLEGARSLLRDAGYRNRVGCAPTPLAALALARAGRPAPVLDLAKLPSALADLPLGLLLDPDPVLELRALGVERWGALDALPRAGLRLRFGGDVLDRLDRAYGRAPDIRAPVEVPTAFRQELDLPFEVETAGELLFVASRLVDAMVGFLTHRELATSAPLLTLLHEGRSRTELEIGLARPTSHGAFIVRVLKERLDRTRLNAPVRAVVLDAGPLSAATASTADLFGADASSEDVPWLLSRLRARWGQDGVVGVGTVPDHRPERAWRLVDPGTASPALPVGPRPLWLVDPPQLLTGDATPRLEGVPFALVTRAERIETGWWDGEPVARDYHVARTPGGRQAWLFRDRGSREWFLHGWFR